MPFDRRVSIAPGTGSVGYFSVHLMATLSTGFKELETHLDQLTLIQRKW